jgi:hypothetical protein
MSIASLLKPLLVLWNVVFFGILCMCMGHIIFVSSARKYHVTVTNNELSFGYSTALTSKTIALQTNTSTKIISVNVIDSINGLFDWGGYGIRFNNFSFNPCGCICRNGPGLEVVVGNTTVQKETTSKQSSQEQTYVFNCLDPKLVRSILEKYNTK